MRRRELLINLLGFWPVLLVPIVAIIAAMPGSLRPLTEALYAFGSIFFLKAVLVARLQGKRWSFRPGKMTRNNGVLYVTSCVALCFAVFLTIYLILN